MTTSPREKGQAPLRPRHGWSESIRTRLVWSVAAVHVALVALVVADVVERQRRFLSDQDLQAAHGLARTVALASTSWVLANDGVGLAEVVTTLKGYPSLHYALVVSPEGRVLAHTEPSKVGLFLRDGPSLSMLEQGPRPFAVVATSEVLDVASPVLGGAEDVVGWVRIGMGREAIQANLEEVTHHGVAFTLVAGALGAAVAWVVSRRMTSGLSRLVAVADQVRGAGDPARAIVDGNDEVARLARSFNAMLDSIKAKEEELRVQEARLDLATTSGKLGLWELDLASNRAWRTPLHDELFGYDELQPSWGPDEALRHVVPEDRPIFERAFQEALATGIFHYELRIDTSRGARRWIEAIGQVYRDESGAPVRMAGIVADVTDRKQAEERIREVSAYARSLVEASLDPLVTISPEGKITDVNRATEEATGVPRSRLIGTDFADYFTEPEKARAGYEQVLASGSVRDYPLTLRGAGGRHVDVLYNATVYAGSDGTPLGVFAAARDVTGWKRAEASLHASEARFRALAERAPVGIYQLDANGRAVYLNRAGQEIIGMPADGPAAERWLAALHPDDRERVVREAAEAAAGGRVFESEHRFVHPDGKVVIARHVASVLRDPEGKIDGHIGVLMDVTSIKAMEAQLGLNSRLAALGTLVAGVAHEVNNPLAAAMADQGVAREMVTEVREILLSGDALDRKGTGQRLDAAIEGLADAEEGHRRIAQIVKDLAAFARPSHEMVRFRLIEAVHQAMRWLPASVSRSATVTIEDGGAPDVVASVGQIEQVIVNLLTNAAKAAKPGKPGVIIVRTGPGSPGMARLDVIDHGTGIDPKIRHRIFDPFFTTRSTGDGRGSGLGLSICHTIVTNHGGTITVQSEVGKGSTFRVELPAAPAGV